MSFNSSRPYPSLICWWDSDSVSDAFGGPAAFKVAEDSTAVGGVEKGEHRGGAGWAEGWVGWGQVSGGRG